MDNFNKTDDLYDPNFSIDSNNTEKLDMYGVWLKKKKDTVEPLDMEEPQTESDSNADKDMESINFDDDFSFSDMDTDIEIPEFNELKDDNSSAEIPLKKPTPSYTDSDSSEVALDEDSFESLDLDDFLSDDNQTEGSHQETSETFVEEEPIDLDFTEMTDDTTVSQNNGEPPAGLENFSEISLEDFEDAAPSSTDEFEPVEDFDDILKNDDSEAQKAEHNERKDEAALDINVTADDEASKAQPISELSSQVVEDNADISIFGADEDKTDEKTSDTKEAAFFDDIEAVKQDLLSTRQSEVYENDEDKTEVPIPEKDAKKAMNAATAAPQTSTAEQDKSTELLMKIAHEISDLKAELNSLKAGMAAQAKAVPEMPTKDDAAVHQANKTIETENSGFFSDDDTDETIALTGDELNNILITADFTEERNAEEGERTVVEESQAVETAKNYEVPPVLTKDIDPEMEETPPVDHAFEDSIEESHPTNADSNYKPETEGEKLLASDPVFNVEAAPITSLPEDLSYLDDQSDVADESIELIDEDSTAEQEETELEEVEDAEPADDETDFEEINIESFDIPSEQEIEVPLSDTEPVTEQEQSTIKMTEGRTIHELQKDEDFPNPFADDSTTAETETKEEIIEESFTDDVPAVEPEIEETKPEVSEESIEELTAVSEDAIPELEPEAENENVPGESKQETLLQAAAKKREATISIPLELKNEIKSVLSYMDQLLEALPEKKIEEFAKSEYFETYKHLFEELGIS